jgi:phage tail-like protein
MAEFTVNPQRVDPYKSFMFRGLWEGRVVAGVSKVSALKRTTEVVEHREGGDPSTSHKSPGRTKYEPITLERGVTHDPEFEDWAAMVWNPAGGAGHEIALKTFRRDITIELCNEAGQVVMAWKVHRCWPSEYVAVAGLDAGQGVTAYESLVIQNEGWERDPAVKEPVEPGA